MTVIKTAIFTITMLILGTNALCNNSSPGEILRKVATTYKTMKTYEAEGTITLENIFNERKMWAKYSFSITLKKPDLYLITWSQTNLKPGETNSRTVWNDESQPYLYFGKINAFYEMTSDEMALSSVNLYNGPFLISLLFLTVSKEYEDSFSWFKDPKIEMIEKVGEEDCYVISGSSAISTRETLWISKSSYLIRKYYQSLDSFRDDRQPQEMTDEEKALRETVIERTQETSRIEVHTKISSPELNKSDFKFSLPERTVLLDWRKDWRLEKIRDMFFNH